MGLTTPGQQLLTEAGSPEWMIRYNLRVKAAFSAVMSSDLSNAGGVTLPNYSNDAAAAAGGVAVGSFYRNGSTIQVRVS